MKPRRNSSIDGFIPRRHDGRTMDSFEQRPSNFSAEDETRRRARDETPNLAQPDHARRSDIADSLSQIDREEAEQAPKAASKKRFGLFKKRRDRHASAGKNTKRRKRIIIAILLLLALIAGYFGYRMVASMLKLTHGNLIGLIEPGEPLKTDSEGRTNILVFGTSQDDPAHQDAEGGGGLWLTDSIMLMSLNQKNHTIKTVSIPRDLWVKLSETCDVGNQAKINAVYECAAGFVNSNASEQKASDYHENDKKGAKALMDTVKQVTGITPQYFVHVNYSVLRESVDAVGGIKVNIKGDGADGIYDTNFDWKCPNGPYTCKNVYYPHDGDYTLSGEQALNLARARSDGGLYSYKNFGLARGDFDRQINQQKILQALKAKATSAGTLANPLALTNLLEALGDNVTTDLSTGNYKTLLDFAKKMPEKDGMKSIDLASDGTSVFTSQMLAGQSVQTTVDGLLQYDSLIKAVGKAFSTNPAVAEDASIAVYNASGVAGAAGTIATKLSAGGLNVVDTGNASQALAGSSQYTIYDTTSGKKPKTIEYLKSTLSGANVSADSAPAELTGPAEIIIVINPTATSTTQ